MRAEQVTDPITYHGEGPVWAASVSYTHLRAHET